ncbi:recombination-associated protein RdgC, partial [Raoultella sp. 18111]|uniref:recombination-associated protein RdgC n=1 Tax=Raoultella sp. 18111 TaxID=2681443 RepID=UPI0013596F5A
CWVDLVAFVLPEGLQIKKVSFLDTVFEGRGQDDSGFDTDVAIATGELSKLIPDLIEALGGEGRTGLDGPAPAPGERQADAGGAAAAPAAAAAGAGADADDDAPF